MPAVLRPVAASILTCLVSIALPQLHLFFKPCCALVHAGFAGAESTAVAQALSDALTCGCDKAGATAQALANAVASSGCGKVSTALAG